MSPDGIPQERIPVEVHADAAAGCATLARAIAELVRSRQAAGKPCVLGLATGSTPVPLYRELIRLHREEGLSFAHVTTFNLDEYHGLPEGHPQSYRVFMHEQFFRHVDFQPGANHLPDVSGPRDAIHGACLAYERAIREAGGIDLQVLGIGRTGHIGFNEPGSAPDSRTRLVTLDRLTRSDAARDFLGETNVPRHAVTMGVGTILEARRIVLLAWGHRKASVVARAVEEPPTDALPASLLQRHGDVRFVVDGAAAVELTRVRRPWLSGASVAWTPRTLRRAVCWLALRARRPVLKLLDEHYAEGGLADLLTQAGPAYDLNIRVFNEVQHTITGWPGGKPGADDRVRPERALPHPRRVLVLSPEPADCITGMGGTIERLVAQGHAVTVAALTSGNLAVSDEEAALAAGLVIDIAETLGEDGAEAWLGRRIQHLLTLRHERYDDSPEVRRMKGMIRRNEFRAALRQAGVAPSCVRFLQLPFYENGRYRQFRPGDADVDAVVALLAELAPHSVFVTGRGVDPASVAGSTWSVVARALERSPAPPDGPRSVWLYAASDHAWEPGEADMVVPLSPGELARRSEAIYQVRSQRSQTPLPAGAESAEPWKAAHDRDCALAGGYDALGLAEYAALEGFVRLAPDDPA